MARLGVLLLPLSLVVVVGCGPESGPLFHKLSYKEALEKALAEKKPVMIDFYADWCGPCKQLETDTFSDAKVRQFLRDKTIPIRVNIDDRPALSQKHKVTGIPCMVFLDGDGNEMGRIQGFEPPGAFLAEVREIVK